MNMKKFVLFSAIGLLAVSAFAAQGAPMGAESFLESGIVFEIVI